MNARLFRRPQRVSRYWLPSSFGRSATNRGGSRKTYYVRDVLDIASMGYIYDDVVEALVGESVEPELVGESEEPDVPLEPGARYAVSLQPPDEWGLVGQAREAGVLDERRSEVQEFELVSGQPCASGQRCFVARPPHTSRSR